MVSLILLLFCVFAVSFWWCFYINIPFEQALDTLGNTKWRVNRKILDVVERLWADGGNIAGLVNREDVSKYRVSL